MAIHGKHNCCESTVHITKQYVQNATARDWKYLKSTWFMLHDICPEAAESLVTPAVSKQYMEDKIRDRGRVSTLELPPSNNKVNTRRGTVSDQIAKKSSRKIKPKKKKKRKTSRTYARRAIAKGTAAKKKRPHKKMKRGYRMYTWVAHGQAADYLCSRYVGTVWSAAYEMPVPGTSTDMNDTHVNCVIGSTRVRADSIKAITRAMYKGIVFDIVTAAGSRISVTPNHMIMTPHGFCAAQFLRKSDNIISSARTNPNGSFHSNTFLNSPYNDHMPPTIEQVFKTLSESRGMRTVRMPISSKDLHGDGKFCQDNIDVIHVDGFLRRDGNSTILQKSDQSTLMTTTPCIPASILLPSNGPEFTFMNRYLTPADRLMSGRRTTSPHFWSRIPGRQTLSASHASNLNTVTSHDQINRPSTYPRLFENLQSTQIPHGIHIDHITDIRIRQFVGWFMIFNLIAHLQ